MTHENSVRRGSGRLALPLLALFGSLWPQPAAAQEGGDSVRERIQQDLGTDDSQAQMLKLFAQIERNLRSIDDLLFEAAGADEQDLEEGQRWRGWIDESQKKSQAVLDDIDKLLELSQQMSNQSRGRSSSSGSQGQSSPESSEQGQSPLDAGKQGGQRRQEGGSQSPRKDLEQAGQQPSEAEGQGSKQSQSGQQPQGSQGQPQDAGQGQDAAQRAGQRPAPGSERGAGSNPVAVGEWGELPPRVQEIFSNQNSQDVPLKYRDWIDSYYRRVSKRP